MVPPERETPGIRGNRPRLRGDAVLKPRAVQPARAAAPQKKRVLFVCIGNSCRSQMAEAFARAYGADIMDPHSAGLAPAMMVAPLTVQVLKDKKIDAEGQFPKSMLAFAHQPFDLVVNMSGQPFSRAQTRVIEWSVPDPIGQKEQVYRSVANQIEGLMMRLILDLRAGRL